MRGSQAGGGANQPPSSSPARPATGGCPPATRSPCPPAALPPCHPAALRLWLSHEWLRLCRAEREEEEAPRPDRPTPPLLWVLWTLCVLGLRRSDHPKASEVKTSPACALPLCPLDIPPCALCPLVIIPVLPRRGEKISPPCTERDRSRDCIWRELGSEIGGRSAADRSWPGAAAPG